MVHLPISLTLAVVALNILASVAAPVVQDGELDVRTLEILEPRKRSRAKKKTPNPTPNLPNPPTTQSEKVEPHTPPNGKTSLTDKLKHGAGKALDQLEKHPNTLQAGANIISSAVGGSRGSSYSGGMDQPLEGRAGAPDPLPTNPTEGQNQSLPPSLVVALFMTKKVFFGGIDPAVAKSVKAISHKAQSLSMDKDMALKQPTPSITDTESPPQVQEVSRRDEVELYPRFIDVLGEVH